MFNVVQDFYAFLSSTVYKRGNFEDILKNVSN